MSFPFGNTKRGKAQGDDVESGALNHLSWNLINHVFEPLFAPFLASCFGSLVPIEKSYSKSRLLDIGPKLLASLIL